MTQQRSSEAIREHVAEAVSDYCIHVGPIPPDESVCHECRRIADAVFDADVAPLLARVSELEQENREWEDEYARDVKFAVARAERAEAQVRAIEARSPLEPQHDERCERRHPDYFCACSQRAALAAGLSLQEEQPKHLVGAGGWRACDTAADWAGSDTTGVTCAECLATTTDVLQEEQE